MRVLSKLKKPKATRILGGALGLLLVLTLVLMPAPALAVPPLPHQFYGTVTIDAELAPEGTIVSAQIGEVSYLSATVDAQGRYGYDPLFQVPADDPDTPEKEGGVTGETVEFYVSDTLADQYEFEVWGITELNLTVGEVPTQYSLDVDTVGSGSVTKDPDQVTYAADTVVELTAIADPDWSFSEWSGDLTGTTNPDSITMDGNKAVTATFAEEGVTYDLTMAAEPEIGGTATDVTGLSPYAEGAEVSIKAEAAADYQFVNWTAPAGVFADASEAETTFTMPGQAATVTANFESILTFTITASAAVGGTIDPEGDIVVNEGQDQTFTIIPNTGYAVADVLVDDVSEGAVESYTFENVTADHTIAASFATTETFTITATAGDNGTISPSGDVVVNSGASQAFTITPETGFTVADVLVDSVSEGAISSYTFENVTADHTIAASFAEVTGDLGDLVDETEPGGTLELPAGTYTGDVIIDQPITITGTEGETIISGGIHIVPLVGSNVTLEYLTITDYTGYGIWISLVDTDDVFTIRNNTIEGVEGSVIGIQVDEVVTGGSLLITQNSISHNEVGVKLLAAVADGGIQFNDITGNTIGLEQLAEVIGAYAGRNWWGDISGPGEENENPGGIGDNVTGNIGYYPWLTRDFQTVLDDNIAYFGLPAVGVDTGWNIISTPIALDPACDTWGEYVALGDGLSTDNTSPAYRFDAQTQAWVALSSDDTLEPCDAIYVRMAEPDVAAILYSPNVSVPAKQLYSGWNLVSLAWLPSTMEDVYGLPADEALVSVAEVPGGLNGYVLVVSPSVNPYEGSWIYTAGQSIEPWTDPNVWPPPDGYMLIASGYWVFMLNDGTLAGFTFTPVSLSLPPAPAGG